MNQQQKNAIISQLQDNMQQQQQQMLQRQHQHLQGNSNDDGSQQSSLDYLMHKNDMNNNSDGQNRYEPAIKDLLDFYKYKPSNSLIGLK